MYAFILAIQYLTVKFEENTKDNYIQIDEDKYLYSIYKMVHYILNHAIIGVSRISYVGGGAVA